MSSATPDGGYSLTSQQPVLFTRKAVYRTAMGPNPTTNEWILEASALNNGRLVAHLFLDQPPGPRMIAALKALVEGEGK